MNAISVEALTKIYPPRRSFGDVIFFKRKTSVPAIRNLNLNIKKGSIFGLLGENGAGKTTLMKSIASAILPTSGKITVNGFDICREPDSVKKSLGFVSSDGRSFYWRLTGIQNLMFFARLYGLNDSEARIRINRLLETFRLEEYALKTFRDYSSGIKQRFSIIRGLLHNPEILLLDEPTRSLDPSASHSILTHLERLNNETGITVFISTHDLEEAKGFCHRLGVLRKGTLCWEGTSGDFSALPEENVMELFSGSVKWGN